MYYQMFSSLLFLILIILTLSSSSSSSTTAEPYPFPFSPIQPDVFPSLSSYGRLNYSTFLYSSQLDLATESASQILKLSPNTRYVSPLIISTLTLTTPFNRTLLNSKLTAYQSRQDAWFSNGTEEWSGRTWGFVWSDLELFLNIYADEIDSTFWHYIRNTSQLNIISCSCYGPLSDGPSYTNNFFDGLSCELSVALFAGNSSQIAYVWEVVRYGARYITKLGINEFNSWYYSVDMIDLQEMYAVCYPEALCEEIRILLKFFWISIAANYFVGIGDMSGPSDRTYDHLYTGGFSLDNAFNTGLLSGGDSLLSAYQFPFVPYAGMGDVLPFQGPSPSILHLALKRHSLEHKDYNLESHIYEPIEEIKTYILDMPYKVVIQTGPYVGMQGATPLVPSDTYHYVTPYFSIGCTSGPSNNEGIDIVTRLVSPYYNQYLKTHSTRNLTNFITLPSLRIAAMQNQNPWGTTRTRTNTGTFNTTTQTFPGLDPLHPPNFQRCVQSLGLQLITSSPGFNVQSHDMTNITLARELAYNSNLATYMYLPIDADYVLIDKERLSITPGYTPIALDSTPIFTVVQNRGIHSYRIISTSYSAAKGTGPGKTWESLSVGPIKTFSIDNPHYEEIAKTCVPGPGVICDIYDAMLHITNYTINNRVALLALHHAPALDDVEFNNYVKGNYTEYLYPVVIIALAEELPADYTMSDIYRHQDKLRNHTIVKQSHTKGIWSTDLTYVDPDDPNSADHPTKLYIERTFPFNVISNTSYDPVEHILRREINGRSINEIMTTTNQNMAIFNVTAPEFRLQSWYSINADNGKFPPHTLPFNVTLPTTPIPNNITCIGSPLCKAQEKYREYAI